MSDMTGKEGDGGERRGRRNDWGSDGGATTELSDDAAAGATGERRLSYQTTRRRGATRVLIGSGPETTVRGVNS